MEGMSHMIEPDGIPNERNQPVNSLQTNVWYHLGLTYYLLDDHEKAINAYEKCIDTWDINDNYVSTANWYYQSSGSLEGTTRPRNCWRRPKSVWT